MYWINKILKFVVPHFFTSLFAINIYDDGDWSIYCELEDIEESDEAEYDYYATISGFTWLGLYFFIRILDLYDLEGNELERIEENG